MWGWCKVAALRASRKEPLDGSACVQRPGPGPLQGHDPLQRGIPRPVDDPEGTLADHVPQLVAADADRRPRRTRGFFGRDGRLLASLGRHPPLQIQLGNDQIAERPRVVDNFGESLEIRPED
jgi:hypothetical protein